MAKKGQNLYHLMAGPLLFAMIMIIDIPGLSNQGKAVLACTVWVAYWWITEATELSVTSLLPIVIFPISGALPLKLTTAAYGNPFIFLFMGGFILGIAIEKWNLHQRIAYNIIRKTGTSERGVLLGFMIATAFMSMWISNTATAVMMLPIGMSVISALNNNVHFGRQLMLGIAYSASIGGIATLIGTPPNIILAGVVKESMNIDLSFGHWMLFATPFASILLLICWWYLARKLSSKASKTIINLNSLPSISLPEKRVLVIFSIVVFMWLTRTFIFNKFIPSLDDTIIAIMGALALFIIPSSIPGKNLMDWESAKNLPWSVLLIFGAGLAIAKGFSDTDLTTWITEQISGTKVPTFIILLLVIAAINFLTEITSNTATASITLPLLFTMSLSLQMDSLSVLVGAAIASSCAFMLPVATPPNAVVFSSGYIKMKEMVKAGFFMNIVSIALIYIFVEVLLKVIF